MRAFSSKLISKFSGHSCLLSKEDYTRKMAYRIVETEHRLRHAGQPPASEDDRL